MKRIPWIVCGRKIGTATGWDQADTFAMSIYDFKPAVGCKIPEKDFVNFSLRKWHS